MTTDHLTLKKFLAEKLPENLYVSEGATKGSVQLFWFNNDVKTFGPENEEYMQPVLETEMPHIVQLLEAKLTKEQLYHYHLRLNLLWSETEGKKRGLSLVEWLIRLDYPTRATALREIL